MNTASDAIDIREPIPSVHVVDPAGRVREFRICTGLNYPQMDGDQVKPHWAALGWERLDSMYEREGPDGGFAVYLSAVEAGNAGAKVTPISDAWLPPSVVARRAVKHEAAVWTEPPPPAPRKAKRARDT